MSQSWSSAGRLNSEPPDDVDLSNGLSDALRAQVKGELEPGERLLWAGRSSPPPIPPGRGFYLFTTIALLMLGFGVVNLAPTLVRRHARPDESSMGLGIVLVLVGTLLSLGLAGNVVSRRKERRLNSNVCYAVTDRRVIIWTPEPDSDGVRIFTMAGAKIENFVRVQYPDGSGDLEFSGVSSRIGYYYYNAPVFKHIPEARRVEQIIRKNLMDDGNRSRVDRERSETLGDVTW